MHHTVRRLIAGAALAGTTLLPQAYAATVLDFESDTLTGLYFAGESFSQSGYNFNVVGDFGVIDTAATMGAQGPSGNATQFYFNSNNGMLVLTSASGTTFSLDGFSAAFVPLEPASSDVTFIVARGTLMDDSEITAHWSFATSATSSFPFSVYSGASFSAFTDLKRVSFYACSIAVGDVCALPTSNNGQFAIDNIVVSAVPEPAPAALLALGLLALGLRARRAAR